MKLKAFHKIAPVIGCVNLKLSKVNFSQSHSCSKLELSKVNFDQSPNRFVSRFSKTSHQRLRISLTLAPRPKGWRQGTDEHQSTGGCQVLTSTRVLAPQ